MKKQTIQEKERREALTDDLPPKDAWTLSLLGRQQDYNKGLNGLIKLVNGIKEHPEVFTGDIPPHYVALAEKFVTLTNILKNAFGE